MVAIDSRSSRESPFSATVRSVLPSGPAEAMPAVVEAAFPWGGVVRLPQTVRAGDRFVLSVQAAQYNLLDVWAEIINVEPADEGGCRAGVEFRPALPKRQFVLMRRVADRPAAPVVGEGLGGEGFAREGFGGARLGRSSSNLRPAN